MTFLKITILAAIMALPLQASGEALNIRNAGAAPCSQVSAAYSENNEADRIAFLQWASGYAVAAAQANKAVDVLPMANTSLVVEMSIMICAEDKWKGATYQAVLLEAIARLKPFWATSPEVLNLSEGNSETALIYKDAVQPLQDALIRRGAGIKADGKYGNRTGAMVARLHSLLKLPPTKIPTAYTFYALTSR